MNFVKLFKSSSNCETDIYLKKDLRIMFFYGMILGMFLFVLLYGVKILDFTNVSWIRSDDGDLTLTQTGWEFFRNSKWMFPLGMTDQIIYPYKLSLVYSDPIPLFAIFFKILSPILPRPFQYLGLWGLVCFMLQGGFACICIRRYCNSKVACLISSAFFIYSTVLIQRLYTHTTLGGQFIILAAISMWIYKPYIKSLKINIIIWSSLMVLSVLIMPYFIIMIVLLMCGYLLCLMLDDIKNWKSVLLIGGSSFLFSCLFFYIIGGFSMSNSALSGQVNYYTLNLDSFFNPIDWSKYSINWSRIIKALPLATRGQYEGVMYLGLGLIFLIPVVILVELKNIKAFHFSSSNYKLFWVQHKSHFSMAITLIILFFFASGFSISYGTKILFTIPLPTFILKYYSAFRSCGRFFWPGFYIIVLFLISRITLHIKQKQILTLFLSFILYVQMFDLFPNLYVRSKSFHEGVPYQSQLKSSFWSDESKTIKHLVFLPWYNVYGHNDLEYYASDNKMTVNCKYICRYPSDLLDKTMKSYFENVNNLGNYPDTMFSLQNTLMLTLFKPTVFTKYAALKVDNQIIMIDKKNLRQDVKYSDVESINYSTCNIADYINQILSSKNNLFFITINKNAGTPINTELMTYLNKLGLSIIQPDKDNSSCFIGISNLSNLTSIYEKADEYSISEHLQKGLSINNITLKSDIEIQCSSLNLNRISKLTINGADFSLDSGDINIAIYNMATDKIEQMAYFSLDSSKTGTAYSFYELKQ